MKRTGLFGLGLAVLLSACGSTAPTPSAKESLVGTWTGTTTIDDLALGETTFNFVLDDDDVVRGTAEIVGSERDSAEVVASFSEIDIDVRVYTTPKNELDFEGGDVTYLYEGTLSGTTFSGDVLRLVDGAAEGLGAFSVTKD